MSTPIEMLNDICGEIYARWDKDQRSGKLLSALGGTMTNYRADVMAVRRALEGPAELIAALKMQEDAELAHANCDECEGQEVPELCEKCFPLYDDARVARRAALSIYSSRIETPVDRKPDAGDSALD